jgi:acylphosphatase
MRDLLNIIQQLSDPKTLTEATRGLLYREKGDTFFKGNIENPEQVLVFDEVKYFPGMPGQYETPEEMIAVYQKLEKTLVIQPANNPNKSMKSFALLKMHDEATNEPIYFAKFFGQILPDMTGKWTNTELKDSLGYQLNKATSLKSSYSLKPADIFPPNSRFKNIQALYNAFKASDKTPKFLPGFSMLYGRASKLPVFTDSEKYLTAIRDDLGEIIGPVALIQGLDVGTGAEAARKDLLGPNGSWAGSAVSFPSGKTNGLVDSYIFTPEGLEVGISSKGEKGATASVKNINDGVIYVKTKGTDEQKKLLTKYAKQVKIINDVGTANTIEFPLRLGVDQGFISKETAFMIQELIREGAKSIDDIDMDENTKIELINLVQTKGAKDENMSNYNIGYRALASLAEAVADYINSDPLFGEACLKFLNSSPLIQLHAKAKQEKDGSVSISEFTSKYPPNFQGTVKLDPTKTYSSTGAGGRMGFAYNGKDADEPEKSTKSKAKINKELTKVAEPNKVTKLSQRVKAGGDVGRSKQSVVKKR